VNLFLVKPACYDDDGYVVRYFRGVLPSNTLACLAALTQSACRDERLADVSVEVHLIDELVMKVDCDRIAASQTGDTRTIVGLVGVQTHQFPRAADIARELRKSGLTVLIGGFHVSGHMALHEGVPPEIQELLDLGVTVVRGEVEETWTSILVDAVEGRLAPLYDFTDDKPALNHAPIPLLRKKILRRFVASKNGTIDCGRGCPFNCSFCTIINVQGRKMRFRSPELIVQAIRENYAESGAWFYFFTDDNFARNSNWEPIFDALIDLRENEGIPVQFMMQVDVLSYKIKGFVDKARRAGCSNVFIGMESLNDDNLQAVGKRQNKADDFRALIDAYRSHEIATHVGYILGFPFDTPESIRRDLDRLMHEVQVDMASFFMLVPLPGSRDHREMQLAGAYMHPDFNRYDSQHETMHYPGFPEPGQLRAAYDEAWKTFYSFENLVRVLKRAPARNYWNLFQNFIWYRSAALIEKRHPMTAGFLRLKGRKYLRPGVAPLPRRVYYSKRVKELAQLAADSFRLLLEMQLLWLETRRKSQTEQRVLEELRALREGTAAVRVRLGEVQAAYLRARDALPQLHVPSRFRLFFRKWNPFTSFSGFYIPEDVIAFWNDCLSNLRRGKVTRIPVTELLTRLLLDLRLSLHFAAAWMRNDATSQ